MLRRVLMAIAFAAILAVLVASSPRRLAAQVGGPLQPPTTGGLPVLLQELRMLGHTKRVLVIGAHPDDEDTELLVMLTRREGAEAAYLSLTRGEGGQNLIGSELGEALGILRTEELMAARNVDGAQQFFTRAYDFGFSKTLDDTWAHWPKDSVLKDVVRIVRRFRPQVIMSVFSGTPRDGHGQHQAAGWAAAEAFRIAGDASRFPELKTEEGLDPWSPTKLYTSGRFGINAGTLTLDGGEVEKVSGKTYHQLAMAARSQHRSQDFGVLQEFGPSPVPLHFVLSKNGAADNGEGWAAFWSGVDTVLRVPPTHFTSLAAAVANAGRDRRVVRSALLSAESTFAAVRIPEGAGAGYMGARGDYWRHLTGALEVASWLFVDATTDRARVSPGEQVGVQVTARAVGAAWPGTLQGVVVLRGVTGRRVLMNPSGEGVTGGVEVAIPAEFAATTPYYMQQPRVGDLYAWPAATRAQAALPRGWDEFTLSLSSVVDEHSLVGPAVGLSTIVTQRIRDQAFGEVRHPLVIVPRVSVKLTPGVAVVRTTATGDARVVIASVELESGLTTPVNGTVTVEVPNGWPKPTPVPFALNGLGSAGHVSIRVTVPAGVADGQYPIRAIATDAAGQRYDVGAFTVEYPHIRSRQYTKPATARIEVIELVPPQVRSVAYVRGAADKVPEALAAAGLTVTILDSTALASGDLSRFDAIVVGPRAYEVDSSLVRNNQRLTDYARDGGRVIVQYQQQVYLNGGFAPFALGGNSRITDENAPVTMLGATPSQSALAPVFRTPNAIGPDDWQGWVQERALYCPTTWGPELSPLLSMNDPNEAPLRGCLLEGKVGRGSYVYTGISFFRELPAGVPGAYRLFFNLLGGRATP